MAEHEQPELSGIDRFHAHLDICEQCREHPFQLCPTGVLLITSAVADLAVEATKGREEAKP